MTLDPDCELPALAYEDLAPLPAEEIPDTRRITQSYFVPDSLRQFADTVHRVGHADTTAGRLLAWFGMKNRAPHAMGPIARALTEVGLTPGGAFATGSRNDRVRFFADGRPSALVIPDFRMDEHGLLRTGAEESPGPRSEDDDDSPDAPGDPTAADWLEREKVARGAGTTPEVLAALAADAVFAVRDAVARNRRTPVATLRTLAHHHPLAVATNPATPLELLASLDVTPES